MKSFSTNDMPQNIRGDFVRLFWMAPMHQAVKVNLTVKPQRWDEWDSVEQDRYLNVVQWVKEQGVYDDFVQIFKEI